MFDCWCLARGSTFSAHLVSLLVKAGSTRPSLRHDLDKLLYPPAQTVATEEEAIIASWFLVESGSGYDNVILTFPKGILAVLCTIGWRILHARQRSDTCQ